MSRSGHPPPSSPWSPPAGRGQHPACQPADARETAIHARSAERARDTRAMLPGRSCAESSHAGRCDPNERAWWRCRPPGAQSATQILLATAHSRARAAHAARTLLRRAVCSGGRGGGCMTAAGTCVSGARCRRQIESALLPPDLDVLRDDLPVLVFIVYGDPISCSQLLLGPVLPPPLTPPIPA